MVRSCGNVSWIVSRNVCRLLPQGCKNSPPHLTKGETEDYSPLHDYQISGTNHVHTTPLHRRPFPFYQVLIFGDLTQEGWGLSGPVVEYTVRSSLWCEVKDGTL